MGKQFRIELTLDEALVARAREATGIIDMSALITEALRAITARESARALARSGGTQPHIERPRRR